MDAIADPSLAVRFARTSRGTAMAKMMPSITMTAANSTRVKPPTCSEQCTGLRARHVRRALDGAERSCRRLYEYAVAVCFSCFVSLAETAREPDTFYEVGCWSG